MTIKCAIGYTVAYGRDLAELCTNVKEYLKKIDGWEPTGSISEIGDGEGGSWFIQGLTRFTHTDPTQHHGNTIWPER